MKLCVLIRGRQECQSQRKRAHGNRDVCIRERERESSAASGFAIGGRKRSQAIQVASRSWEKQEK